MKTRVGASSFNILKFEGNTGVYELYTVVRLNSILQKNKDFLNQDFEVNSDCFEVAEFDILKQIYTLENILEKAITQRLLPFFYFEFLNK